MTYNEIKNKVIEWANQRNIISEKNINTQLLKFFEESGELSKAILENNKANIIDSIGDVLVTLEILVADLNKANIINKSLIDCYETAYSEIKNRKGKTENGVFVKSKDEALEQYKKEEETNEVICKCGNVVIKNIGIADYDKNGEYTLCMVSKCLECKTQYETQILKKEVSEINKMIQETINNS
jgi:NTP pyrophosphatase (non-canonical NTP hydrolase)